MLSETSKPYIDASVPVLREHGGTITHTFYRNMFAEYPELTNIFNMGNQANGSQQQSLAAAVFAFAANHANPGALEPVIGRIAEKHASVGITSAHYPIVGRHLLGAIQETLGEAATPPLLAAWAEAYQILADILIAAEKKLYESRQTEAGVLTPMRVASVRTLTDDVRSFTLEAIDKRPQWDFKPGQYISVAVHLANGQRQLRQYSLSDAPGSSALRISVKREESNESKPEGMVSNWLHANLREGDTIEVSPPFGDFTPQTHGDEPVVLLSAGIGITPMISALNHIHQTNPQKPVIFAHATRSAYTHAHKTDIEAARQAMPALHVATFYESMENAEPQDDTFEGFMKLEKLPHWDRAATNVYLCGPLPFMRAQWLSLTEAGVPAQRLHREVFGPELLDHLL